MEEQLNLPALERSLTVAQVLQQWPQAAGAFIRLRTACVGCAVARFCTLEEVARQYHMDINNLINELVLTTETQSSQS